jgi:uncharacterized protein (TIGR02246 family)
MTKPAAIITAGLLAIASCTFPVAAVAGPGDEAKIRALEKQFAAAFNAKDADAIMKVYVPGDSLIVFDLVPPLQYVGAQAYHDNWVNFFKMFKGPLKFEMSDLYVMADGKLAYSHSIQHLTGTQTNGNPIDVTVRVTDVYGKIKGQWLIVHEHVSVPVDLDTGKPDLASKP